MSKSIHDIEVFGLVLVLQAKFITYVINGLQARSRTCGKFYCHIITASWGMWSGTPLA